MRRLKLRLLSSAKFEATVEPLSAADEIAVEAVDVDSEAVGAEYSLATATFSVKVGTTFVEAEFDDIILEANQANFDVAATEANFKTEADEVAAEAGEDNENRCIGHFLFLHSCDKLLPAQALRNIRALQDTSCHFSCLLCRLYQPP